MKYGFWEYANRESRMAAIEHTIFLPRISGYRHRLTLSGLRVHQHTFDLKPQDTRMWSFLTPPAWDSTTVPLGCRFEELTRIKDSRYSHRPWIFPKSFDIPQTDSLVNFKAPFPTPTFKNIDFSLSSSPQIIDPMPTLLEEIRTIRREDKEYTDFLFWWLAQELAETMKNNFYDWLYGLYIDYLYVDFPNEAKKLGAFFRQVLSILGKWLVLWLEGIYLD